MGNPISGYNGYTMVWEKGRQLKSMSKSGNSLALEYNANGIRTKKTVNGKEHNYYLQGANILFETIKDGSTISTIQYLYDNNDEISGINYNGDIYYFVKNLQGDVIKLIDSNGDCVVKYTYGAWGKICKIADGNGDIISDTDAMHIANINPIRYRGYYYDTETKLYYLQSRYYDPETGKFINADDFVISINDIEPYNYCNDDPINKIDKNGTFALTLLYDIITGGLVFSGITFILSIVNYSYNKKLKFSGYIDDQAKGNAAKVKMGFYTGDYNGCGWVATYNALIILGKNVHPKDIVYYYEHHGSVLYGTLGILADAIADFFRQAKYKVKVTASTKDLDKKIKNSDATVLSYFHSQGGHHVAIKWDGTNFWIYNEYHTIFSVPSIEQEIFKKVVKIFCGN